MMRLSLRSGRKTHARPLDPALLFFGFCLAMITASAQAANRPPTISGTPATTGTVGKDYYFRPVASDPEGHDIVFSVVNRPSWAQFSTNSGRLSGTPAAPGSWSNIRISVSDGVNAVSLPSFSIKIVKSSNRAPVISGTPSTSVQVGKTYAFQPKASDPDGHKLTYSIQNKPAWAAFSTSSGKLSGTPAKSNIGRYANIVIRVSDGVATTSLPAFRIDVVAPGTTNLAHVISGTPTKAINAGSAYSFQPAASDANGDKLTFAIANRPSWSSFSTSTGRLSGTPGAAYVGNYAGIVISVSDGNASASLPAFTLAVTQISNGAATLSWMPPTQNTDGSPLTNLSGYQIHYGTSASALNQVITLNNPGITTYVIENLAPATYYFALRSVTSAGTESALSAVASKTIH
jgi:hypothetical protein